MLEHTQIKSRQMQGNPGKSSGEMDGHVHSASQSSRAKDYKAYEGEVLGGVAPGAKNCGILRETGATYKTLVPNTEFSESGPDVLSEGRQPVEHTSATR